MPFVNVQTIKGIMNPEQKKELLRRMTDLIVEIEGKGDPEFRRSVWVRIDEHEPEQWSLGGIQPTAEAIAAKFSSPKASYPDGVLTRHTCGKLRTTLMSAFTPPVWCSKRP